MTIKKILFPTDFSRCSDQAFREALFLAERYRAEMHALHVVLPLEAELRDRPSLVPNIEDILPEIGQTSGASHASSSPAIIESVRRGISAGELVLEYAQENDIDLIVMGTHGRTGLKHFMLGSVAEEVVRFSVCPVFTIRETASGPPVPAFRQILVPVDFSEHSRNAVAHAKSIARDYGAVIRVLHVMEESLPPAFYVTGVTSVSSWFPCAEAEVLDEMRRFFANAPGPDVPTEFHCREGRAPIDIITFAKRNPIDLIVMASHGMTGLEHFLLGSVAEKVIRMAPCPVFTVKSFGKRLTLSGEEHLLSSENEKSCGRVGY